MKGLFFTTLVLIFASGITFIGYASKNVVPSISGMPSGIFPEQIIQSSSGGKLISSQSGAVNMLPIGDADSIFFSKEGDVPKIAGSKVEIGKGLYLISLGDPFHEYTLLHADFSISHVANGAYYIDTTGAETKIYSMSALLSVTLLQDKKTLTSLNVFPSEYFSFDPLLAENFQNADVFRLGQIATLTILDHRRERDLLAISSDKKEEVEELFREHSLFLEQRSADAVKIISQFPATEDAGLELIEKYGGYFLNEEKKRVIIRNSFIGLAQKLTQYDINTCDVACSSNQQQIRSIVKNIAARIQDLNAIDPGLGEDAKKILRRYLSLASMASVAKNSSYYTNGGSALVSVYQEIFQKPGSKGGYRLLAELYSQYYFPASSITTLEALRSDLELKLKEYVVYLVRTKAMRDTEFVGFIYFLKEFLGTNLTVNSSTTQLFAQIISIASGHVRTLSADDQKFQSISLFYFTFTEIVDSIREGIVQTYFEEKDAEGKVYLKSEFVSANRSAQIPEGILAGITAGTNEYTVFDTEFGNFFSNELKTTGSNIIDSRSLTESAFGKIQTLYTTLSDYPAYLIKLSLNADASGENFLGKKKEEVTEETVRAYFSQFQGVDPSTFSINTDVTSGGEKIFQVSVTIQGRKFQFQCPQEGDMTLRDIVFTELDGTINEQYRRMSINMEDKKKQYQGALSSVQTEKERRRFDFGNYFENTFFPPQESVVAVENTEGEEKKEMTSQMKLFVQNELINKDFTHVQNTIAISLNYVWAEIKDGEYSIFIQNAPTVYRGKTRTYSSKFRSRYIYNQTTHAFSNITFTVYINENEQSGFDGNVIEVLPSDIPVVEYENAAPKIAKLLDLAYVHYTSGQKNIVLNIDTNTISIDGNSYTLENDSIN